MWEELCITLRRFYRRHRRETHPEGRKNGPPAGTASTLKLTLLLAVLLAGISIGLLELRLRPLVEQLAVHQVDNRVTGDINDAVLSDLGALGIAYEDLVTVQRDSEGAISALTSNMTQINQLRGLVVDEVLRTVAAIDVHTLGVPLGSLFRMDLLWAKGPRIQVKSLVAGTVTVDTTSEFASTGINQTMHRILLEIRVPLTVLLPGTSVETEVRTSLCVAETIIVGKVPDTYLQLGKEMADGAPE